jgi:hypothetical protein
MMNGEPAVQNPDGAHYDPHHGQHNPKWQRHVMVFLWVTLAVFVLVIAGLIYADTHGYFQSSTSRNGTQTPAWPNGPP